MIIPIQPVPAFPKQGTQLLVDDGHVALESGANFQWAILDAEGNIVAGPARNSLTDSQYAAWTSDDEFVARCVAENIGLRPS